MMDFTINDINASYASGYNDGSIKKILQIIEFCRERICLDIKEDGICSHSSCAEVVKIIEHLNEQHQALLKVIPK